VRESEEWLEGKVQSLLHASVMCVQSAKEDGGKKNNLTFRAQRMKHQAGTDRLTALLPVTTNRCQSQ